MPEKTIDYEALAKQAGAVGSTPSVDYESLAKRAGAVGSSEVPEGGSLLNKESQGVSYIRPQVSGPVAGLPEGQSLPRIKQPNPDDVYMHPGANAQLAQFVNAAGQDIKDTGKSITNATSDWYNNNHGLLEHAIALPVGAFNATTGMLAGIGNNLVDSGGRLAEGHPFDALSSLVGGDPDRAAQMAKEGNLGGAAWQYWGKPGTMAAAGEVGGKALGALKGAVRGDRFASNNFTRMISPGFEGIDAYDAAQTLRPLYQQEAKAAGLKDENLLQRMFSGDMPTRSTPGGPAIPEPVQGMKKATEVADRVVGRVHEPIDQVMNIAKNDPLPIQTRTNIINDLLAKQHDAARLGSKNAGAYDILIKRVREAKNFGELNKLKQDANNMLEGLLHGKSPSEIAATSIEPIMAWKDAAGSIRQNMYPDLQRYIAPQGTSGWFDIANQGRLEGMAMDARDGIYKNQAAFGEMNLPEITQKYLERVGEGSLYKSHVARRMIMLNPTPAGQFNRMFRRGLGDLGEGSTASSVGVTPQQLKLPPPSSPNLPSLTPGQPVSIIPPSKAGPFGVTPPPSYPGTFSFPNANPELRMTEQVRPDMVHLGHKVEVPNPLFKPMEGPSRFQQQHELGTTASTIPDRVRGTQSSPRVQADQIGMGHTPTANVGEHPNNYRGLNPPTRSFTGPEMREVDNFQHMFGTGKAPELVADGKAAIITTSNPEAAKMAQDGMRRFIDSDEFKKLSTLDKDFHRKALSDLDKQVDAYKKWKEANPVAPPPNSPTEPKFQVTLTPGTAGKITQKRRTLSWIARHGVAHTSRMGVQDYLKSPRNGEDVPMDQKISEQERLMRQPE